MSASLFAPCAPFRLVLCLVCLLTPALLTPAHGEQPAASKLGPEQERARQDRNNERWRLISQAIRLEEQGKLVEAIATAQKALAITRELLGDAHEEVLSSLQRLAGMYEQREDFAAARTACKEVLAISIKLYGQKDGRVTDARWALTDLDHRAAMTPQQRERLTQAQQLNTQAAVLGAQGKPREAIAQTVRVVAIRKEILGEQHPDYASSLRGLAVRYYNLGEYAKAEPLYRQTLQIRKQALGERHPGYVTSLNELAELYRVMGEYARAEPLYRQALQISKQLWGGQDSDSISTLNNLGMLYMAMHDYARAESLYRQLMKIVKEALGEEDSNYAVSLNNLAWVYQTMGDYAKAEPLLRQTLEIRKKALGEQHPDYARSLNNLAALYHVMGDYARAEPMYRQALQIRKQALGEKHPDYAASLSNLAQLHKARSEYDRAEALFRQALEIDKEALGEQHSGFATDLEKLAMLYWALCDYAKAEPLLRQALRIRKQVLGEKHPDYATSLSNLAKLYEFMGDYAKAEPLLHEAMHIKKQTLGERHPDYADSLNNLAMVYVAQRDDARAGPLLRQAVDLCHANLELAAAAQSQRQQLAMLAHLRWYLDNYVSLAPQTPQETAAQYRAVLAWKGAVGCRQRLQHLTRKRPDLAPDFATLDRLSSRLAALALAMPDPAQLVQRRALIQQLTEEKDQLEAKLARQSAAFGQERQLLEPAQLQAALPADTILVDFLEYGYCRPAFGGTGGWAWQDRVVAFVVGHNRLQRVDLDSALPMRGAFGRWRLALQRRFRTEGDRQLADEMYRLVWKPLQPHLKDARLVLVSPDGVLTRLPFAALPGSKKDSYLLEDMALAIVPVPQLLPQMLGGRSEEPRAEPSLLLVGDVRYDSAAGSAAVADSRAAPRGGALMHWSALEGTRAEVAAIKDSFQRRFRKGSVTDLREDEATEAAVRKEAPARRYVHFATHGFFAPKELRSALATVSHSEKKDVSNLFAGRDVASFHPGLLSGLVLAGANQPVAPDRDDGILTALEVEKLDLSGVELAVLSACETGLGEEAGGEGLLGLQRAFQLAGARGVVAGLWQVDDTATRKLMVEFYSNLWEKKLPRLEALRQAQLWMLHQGEAWMQHEGISRGMVDVRVPKERLPVEDGRLAPYYWAAFSLSGDWR